MKSYTYLLIDVFTVLIPFLFSFHPKLRFDKKWSSFFPSMALVAMIFLIWDVYFTSIGIWGFNPEYLTGIYILNLPLEEILFFICIPYACVFTYHCFDILQIQPFPNQTGRWISLGLIIGLGVLLAFNFGKFYTTSTFVLLLATLIYLEWISKKNLTHFYFSYLVLLIPFAITNGILTGSFIPNEVVWYNDQHNMGFRLGTIPFEDIFYGMLLILWNVQLMEFFYMRNQSKSSAAG
ncbi:MAG: lycopene cyclase domain-containing protein [Reichenbachiella sp.]|uniref:lycopene cyclase domain-containing protein n=1 Tax=Reichenbachiella sp. TaxID=2184521 RepID=UPI002965E868|nr:lycopene cyclase domain-containing protein [Reichenbachiella sp.]MDW3210821.1 lycopene cyclase domain-containing protein [Reichenbachiella sp.]